MIHWDDGEEDGPPGQEVTVSWRRYGLSDNESGLLVLKGGGREASDFPRTSHKLIMGASHHGLCCFEPRITVGFLSVPFSSLGI